MKKRIMLAALAAGAVLMTGSFMAEEAVEAVTEGAVEESTEAEVVSEVVELGERPGFRALDYVTVGDYKDLPVEVDPILITDEDIDAAIEAEIANNDLYQQVTEGVVKEGDTVNIDFVGKMDGEPFDGGSAEGTDLVIGSGSFIEGFEEGLIGVVIGDTVDLNLSFPESYWSEELAGADVVFTVTVNYVKEMPEINDELINTLSGGAYSTVDGYREYQRETLTTEQEELQKASVTTELMTQLYNTCTIDEYPQDLLDYSLQEMTNYYAAYAYSYGLSFDDFLASMLGMDRAGYEAEAEAAVKESLMQELILCAIAETEGIEEITDEEYEAGCEEYAQRLGYDSTDSFKADYDESKIKASLKMDKAMEIVRDNAVIIENEPESESEIMPEEEVTEGITE